MGVEGGVGQLALLLRDIKDGAASLSGKEPEIRGISERGLS